MGVFYGKMGEGVVRCLPSMNSFLIFVFYDSAIFGENPSRNVSVRVHADGQTGRGKLFNNLSHAIYAIAMGQITS